DVNCLEHGGGVTYRPQRQLLCAVGAEAATAERCDTTHIAPVVCGMSTHENSNPFAAFCENAQNDGLNNDAAARLAVRQATLTHCLIAENMGVGVCAATSAGNVITGLETDCKVGVTSVTPRCAYTQYSTTQMTYCTTPGSEDIFDPNCKQGTHGEVDDARETECKKTGSVLFNTEEACTGIVARLCTAGGTSVLQSKTAASGYLCEDKSGTAYNNAREVLCGVTGKGTGDFANGLTEVCKPTLARICMGKEFTTAGMASYNCAENAAFNGVREAACGATPTAPNESDCMATRLRLCTGDGTGLVETAPNGYDCSASRIDTVLAERRRFCANPESGDTTGCPVVLADLCTGDKSLMNDVATGGGVTYDCKDEGDELVLYQRQAYCADGDNDDMVVGCSAVLNTLCTGKLVEIMADTGVTGKTYNCAT
ncbi:MAG: hypothetical protein K8953_05800, partial [Proteobacteria bacterium]|nr:hypothetical protein [Pseudomonadota bacterium]